MEKNPKFPVSLNSKMPALGVTTSQVAADNLNAIHAARQAFIQNESRENIQLALTHHFRTSEDDAYTTVLQKRKLLNSAMVQDQL